MQSVPSDTESERSLTRTIPPPPPIPSKPTDEEYGIIAEWSELYGGDANEWIEDEDFQNTIKWQRKGALFSFAIFIIGILILIIYLSVFKPSQEDITKKSNYIMTPVIIICLIGGGGFAAMLGSQYLKDAGDLSYYQRIASLQEKARQYDGYQQSRQAAGLST